mgnify:CR=1 FL=1
MRIGIPLAQGRLAMHFGHCQSFALIDVDTEKKEILENRNVPAPEHQPGLLPRWLSEQGAEMIIAGGMGSRARSLFEQQNIKVLTGAPAEDPETLVRAYLDESLITGENVCDH